MTAAIIHPTAVIHPAARLGKGTVVGPYAVVEEDVIIGDRCRIKAHAVIKRYTSMADENLICEGAVLGGRPQDLKFSECRSYLRIGSRNVFRENVTAHRATEPEAETRIGSDNYLMVNAHVAHNCILEDHIIIANNVGLAGHVHIEHHAFLSGGVMVHQFGQIGRFSMIGGHAKITQDVLPFFLVDGIPARVRGLNLVGLKRSGFSHDEILDLKRAYRILLQSGLKLNEKLAAMQGIDSDHVRHLISFIQNSTRGFCKLRKSSGRKRIAQVDVD
jgi:UDP-N-acetylglucosamine acyltransferase